MKKLRRRLVLAVSLVAISTFPAIPACELNTGPNKFCNDAGEECRRDSKYGSGCCSGRPCTFDRDDGRWECT